MQANPVYDAATGLSYDLKKGSFCACVCACVFERDRGQITSLDVITS